ncbi:hypothetical protein Tco_1559059 [Tanacetum coccineum]
MAMRAAAPSTYTLASRLETPPSGTPRLLPIPVPTSSPPLLLPSIDCRADVPEVTLPPQKRLCIALGPRYKARECSSAPTARPTGGFRADYGFVGTLDAEIRRDLDREIGVCRNSSVCRNSRALWLMLGVHDLHGDQVFVETQEPMVNAATTTSIIPVSVATATTTTVDELTLAQTLIEIKAAKPKVRGVMIQDPSETTTTTTTPAASKPSQDKGKAKMTESEKPLKKKDQIMYDQEVALNLQAQLQAELEEEERLARQKEEEANISLIESWDNTQAMMDADRLLAERLQARGQE